LKKGNKRLFEGIFNHQRQVFYLYRHAYTERQAWKLFCDEIAKRHGVNSRYVMRYFNGATLNYEIKEVKDERTRAYQTDTEKSN
jgi:AraC-like DNA-binding protein